MKPEVFLLLSLAAAASTAKAQIFEPHELELTPLGRAGPRASCSADFDGDGDNDIAALYSRPSNGVVEILRNDGRGALRADPTTYWTGLAYTVLKAGDLDSDGDVDLWVGVDPGTGARSDVALLNDGTGVFTIVSGVGPAHQGATTGAALFDADGDGDIDCIRCSAIDGWALDINNGALPFVAAAAGSLPPTAGLAGRGAPHIADLDNDGDLDIFADRSLAEVWLNDGTGTFLAANLPGPLRGGSSVVMDADGDGDRDVIVGPATSPFQPAILINQGGGAFAIQAVTPVSWPILFHPLLTEGAVAINVDGDATDELLTLERGGTVLDLRANFSLFDIGPSLGFERDEFPTPDFAGITVAELDGRAGEDVFRLALDEASRHSIWRRRAPGRFERMDDVSARRTQSRRIVIDLDGDGIDDLVEFANNSLAPPVWLAGRGDGRMEDLRSALAGTFTSPIPAAAVGDVDGDGDDDFVCVLGNRGEVVQIVHSGGRVFAARVLHTLAPNTTVTGLEIADLTADGRGDAVLFTSSGMRVLESVATGTWADVSAAVAGQAAGLNFALFGDVDGDGDVDVLADIIYENVGGVLVAGGPMPANLTYAQLAADLDGDRDADLVYVENTGAVLVAYATPGGWSTQPLPGFQVPTEAIDLDLDGRVDLWGRREVLLNTSLGFLPVTAQAYARGSAPPSSVIGDFDGDGDADLMAISDVYSLVHNRSRQLHLTLPADRGFPVEFALSNLVDPTPPALLAIGAAGPVQVVPGLGRVHLDPATVGWSLVPGPFSGSGVRTQVGVPTNPSLVGLVFRAQALFLGSSPRFSNYCEFEIW